MNALDEAISITGITYLVFMGFGIIFLGYLLGRIKIKGVGLGTAGVFIVALVFGVLNSTEIGQTITDFTSIDQYRDVESINYYRILQDRGLTASEAFDVVHARSRDDGRTPMAWNANKNGGTWRPSPQTRGRCSPISSGSSRCARPNP